MSATPIENVDLVERLNDQRITGFNAQMRVREEAAKEIARLRALVAKLQEPPPCQHARQTGWFKPGGQSEMHCQDCGKQIPPLTVTGGTIFITGKGY